MLRREVVDTTTIRKKAILSSEFTLLSYEEPVKVVTITSKGSNPLKYRKKPREKYRKKSRSLKQKVDLNRATIEELVLLKGIGPTLAKRVVSFRDSVGNFTNIREIVRVKGIGKKKLEAISSQIYVK